MTQMRKRGPLSSVVAAGAMSLLLAVPVLASDSTSVEVSGGSLSFTNPAVADFDPVALTGVAQTPATDLDAFTVTDATGTGAGWHVTAQATQFAGADKDLALGSLSMSEPTVDANGTTSPDPTVNGGPYTIDALSAVTIASAAVDEGMGKYDFGATTLTLSLPADVYADTYTSTVTISAITAP